MAPKAAHIRGGATMADEAKWCFAWFAAPIPTDGATRAALEKASKWDTDTISISFMDGTPEQQALVRRFAEGWINGLANLQFSWENPPNTDIRISFRYRGSWSVIGTTARNVPKTRPTMNFGWLRPGVSDQEARRVILHEFGHALGLIHEHQNPLGSIPWNKPAVIADLSGPPNNWDSATIEHNMFKQYSSNEIEGTQLDASSIMMYPIPKSWRTDQQEVGLNSDLSAKDKEFIRKQYP
jgi:hypothetical protein